MHKYASSLCVLVASLALIGVVGCEKEGPAEKAGKEIDKAVLETGKTALEKAKKVGKALEEAAEETAEKVKEAAQ